jgi:hypothetical protein
VSRIAETLHISCTEHIDAAASLYLTTNDCTPTTDTTIPLAPSHYDKISRGDWDKLDPTCTLCDWYRRVIGSLTWIAMCCRPDIAFATHYLSRFQQNMGSVHIAAAKHLLVYLVHTRTLGLLFTAKTATDFGPSTTPSDSLQLYHDATFAGEPSDSSSVSGVLAFINGTPIYWHVSKVSYVTRSSTESELWGADDALIFLEHTRTLRTAATALSPTLAKRLYEPCCTLTDNSALRDMICSADDGVTRTMRHIRTRIHRLRDASRRGIMLSSWIPARAMYADILTKVVPAPLFLRLRAFLVQPNPTKS